MLLRAPPGQEDVKFQEVLKNSDLVFRGKIVAHRDGAAVFRVYECWKGSLSGLLLASYAEAAPVAARPGVDADGGAGKVGRLKMIDVWIPTVDQRWLILPRYTQPSPDTKLLIEKLKWQLPSQPPPRLVAQKQSYEIEVQTVR